MKETIERIMDIVYQDKARITGHMAQALALTIKPILEALGKPEDAPAVCEQLAEQLTPLGEEIGREAYAKFYTDEQLNRLADFHEANPWYTGTQGDAQVWITEQVAQRSRPFVEAILNKYIEDDDEPATAITDNSQIPEALQ
jgi:hypothetical protein